MTFDAGGRLASFHPREIPPREIHVWHLALGAEPADVERLRTLLADDEQARARRFRFAGDERRFVTCRGRVRMILAHYLRVPAATIAFAYGAHGKPFVIGGGVCFNVSHSCDRALIACCATHDVGVDLEMVRAMSDAEALLPQFLSTGEIAEWMALPTDERTRAFFNGWTRKEAYVKALGDGLSHPLDTFRVTFDPHAAPAIIFPGQTVPAWSLIDVSPGPDWAAALAVSGCGWTVRTYDAAI